MNNTQTRHCEIHGDLAYIATLNTRGVCSLCLLFFTRCLCCPWLQRVSAVSKFRIDVNV